MSAEQTDSLVAFFYLLARDGLPWGTINNLVNEATKGAGQDIVFNSPPAEQLAREQVERLYGAANQLPPTFDSLPAQVRDRLANYQITSLDSFNGLTLVDLLKMRNVGWVTIRKIVKIARLNGIEIEGTRGNPPYIQEKIDGVRP